MSQWIEETTAEEFDREVIERSREVPVVVDFWAPWCGPCRMLTPELEAAVEARSGKVRLVKLNTDEHPTLGERFAIRGIPAVKAFVDGELVQEFVGLLDRAGIERFLDSLIPSDAENLLAQAEALLAAGEHSAVAALVAPLHADPATADAVHQDAARLLAARAEAAAERYAAARELLAEITREGTEGPAAEALMTRLELLEGTADADEGALRATLEAADNPNAKWQLAGLLFAQGKLAESLEQLLELLARGRGFKDDGPRRAMLAIFDQLGADDETARDFRRRMQIYL